MVQYPLKARQYQEKHPYSSLKRYHHIHQSIYERKEVFLSEDLQQKYAKQTVFDNLIERRIDLLLPKYKFNDMYETSFSFLLAVESLKIWHAYVSPVESVTKFFLLFYACLPTVYLNEFRQENIVMLLLPFLYLFLITQKLDVLLNVRVLQCFGLLILIFQLVQLQ